MHSLRKYLNTFTRTHVLHKLHYAMFKLAAFGNPLLDIVVKISTKELLDKHNLKEDDQIDIPEDAIKSLYADIKPFPSHVSPGGCALNTIRVLQWLLKEPHATVYFGSIGNDDQGKILTDLVHKSGVTTKYLINENHSTGTCIALVNGPNRSLVAYLGAAEYFDIKAFSPEHLNILNSVKICYMEGFFLTNRLETSQYIQNLCVRNKSVFVFNLSAQYLCRLYPVEVSYFAKKCDILFGNYKEFLTIGEILNIQDPKEVALMLNKCYEKKETNSLFRFGKIVIITNGSDNIMCVYKNGRTLDINVPKIPPENIEDTTGAGDSFVAGFLAALLGEYGFKQCVDYGCWVAGQIIQQIGCTVPDFEPEIDSVL